MLPRSNQKGEQNRQTAVLFIDIEVTTDEEHLFTTTKKGKVSFLSNQPNSLQFY